MLPYLFWKENKAILKYFTIAFVGSSTAWVYYQVNKTRDILENALDDSVLQFMDHYVAKEETLEEEIIEFEPYLEYRKTGLIQWALNNLKFGYARRLLALSKDSNKYFRTKAVNNLANINYLDSWHFALIANMIDPRTAVALARTPNADRRFFLEPPFRYHNYKKDELINAMREFLIEVFEKSQHPCMGYFLSKAFVYDHDSGHIVDHDSSSLELSKFIQTEKEILPMCLESLLHHCNVERYSTDIADLNGLPLLMEIYKRYSGDINVTIKLCQILSYMSYNRHLLEPFCKSGWIGVLSNWAHHKDIRVSIPAARALANLDDDNDARYPSQLYVLHPLNRTKFDQAVDVIFVHGLLGGVFFTWRQRQTNPVAAGFIGSETADSEARRTTKQYFQDITDKILTNEYEIVWNDIPLNSSDNCSGPFTCPGEKFDFDNAPVEDGSYTYCWPKDWLAQDCKNIRVIGINYNTSLSMWAPLCPSRKEKLTLNERSDLMVEKLVQSEVGKRPIVWITHSMGGLIVKNILCKDDENGPVSPLHDIPLMVDADKKIFNMVVEVPRWTNAKMEITMKEVLNPIKQDVKKGKPRFVANCFPHHGYIWNYGALPQTWENPEHLDDGTGCKGDNDPIDVLEIGYRVAKRGEVLQVKVLGTIALIDEGETDWKLIAIDINDPSADQINDVSDVEKHFPGLLKASVEWFKIYKIPDGKPENHFAFNGEAKSAAFAHKIIDEVHAFWKTLIDKEVDAKGISCVNTTLDGSQFKMSRSEAEEVVKKTPEFVHPQPLEPIVDSVYYMPNSHRELTCRCRL
uniref:Inorganic pyrophosphatase n=1 Tax=Dendroctonus ponderosae TaxID=77166 RepID=A0AAR5Q4T6_DENPD